MWARVLLLAALLLAPAWPPEPLPPCVDGYWGMALGMYPAEARRRGFDFPPDPTELAELGATHVTLAVPWQSLDVHDSHIAPGPESLDDGELLDVAASVRRAGLSPVLMPFIRLEHGARDEWRGVIAPRDREAWWRDYRRFILHYARLAEAMHAPLFAVGSELSSMTGPRDRARWLSLCEAVRRVYSGRLAYATNHDALDRRAALDGVDVVGVSAYFRLTDSPDASAGELGHAWREVAGRLRTFASEVGKPLVLFELGYASVDGSAARPWDYHRGGVVDLEEQRRAYRAAVDAILATPEIEGALFWTWFGPGGSEDRWYTPRGKPAQLELGRLFRRRAGPVEAADIAALTGAAFDPTHSAPRRCSSGG